ncbi:MAG: hypothetical protein MJZ64_00375 [Paludibacteraceae bacterium]|nr:hypothetical protein [Paludibacteraceae bacterium]
MDKISQLYQVSQKRGLLANGLTEDMFRQQLQEEGGADNFYNIATERGVKLGNKDSFVSTINNAFQPASPATSAQAQKEERPSFLSRLGNVMLQSGGAMNSGEASAMKIADDAERVRKEEQQAHAEREMAKSATIPMSPADKMREDEIRLLESVPHHKDQARIDALKAQRPSYLQDAKSAGDIYRNYVEGWITNTPEGQQGKQQLDSDFENVVNNLQQQFRDSKTYKDIVGKYEPQFKHQDMLDEFQTSKEYSDIIAEVQAQYNATKGMTEEQANKLLNDKLQAAFTDKYGSRIKQQDAETYKKVEKELNDAWQKENGDILQQKYSGMYQQLANQAVKGDKGYIKYRQEKFMEDAVKDAIQSGTDEIESLHNKYVGSALGNYRLDGSIPTSSSSDGKAGNILAAEMIYRQALTRMQDTKKGEYKLGSATGDFIRNAINTLPNLASFGISDLMASSKQASVLKKIADANAYDNPESVLDESEMALYNAIAANTAAELVRSENTGWGASAAKLSADMLPFVRDIMVGQGLIGGLTESGKKGIIRGIARTIGNGKWAKVLANVGVTFTGFLESAAIAGFTPSTYALAFDKSAEIDSRKLSFDDSKIKIGKIDTKGYGKAWAEAYGTQIGELFTETGGNTQLMLRALKDAPFIKSLGRTKLKDFNQMFGNSVFGQFLNKAAYHGVIGELSEEWENTFYDACKEAIEGRDWKAFGDTYAEFTSPDTQVPMIISFSLPALLGGSASMVQMRSLNKRYQEAYGDLKNTLMYCGVDENEVEDVVNDFRGSLYAGAIEDMPKAIASIASVYAEGNQENAKRLNAALSQYAVADAMLGSVQADQSREQSVVKEQYRQAIRTEQWQNKADEEATALVEGITNKTNNYVYRVGVQGRDGVEGYAVSGDIIVDVNQTDGSMNATGNDVVTVKFDDGHVEQMQASELTILEAPVMAQDRIQAESARLFAKYANEETYQVGDKVYLTNNGQLMSGESSTITGIDDEGIRVEIEDANGQPNETPMPHYVAAEHLAKAPGETEEQIDEFTLPDGTTKRLYREDGFWSEIDDKTIMYTPTDLEDRGWTKATNQPTDLAQSAEPSNGQPANENTNEPANAPANAPSYPVDENGEPAWGQMQPEQSAQVIFDAMGRVSGKDYVELKKSEAAKAVKDVSRLKPRSTSFAAFQQEDAQIKQQQKAANDLQSYWNNVSLAIASIKTEAELQAEEEQRQKMMQAREDRSRTEEGTKANTSMAERYAAAPKIVGNEGTITLPDGRELKGRYILTTPDAATASHDARSNFAMSSGYPVTEDGQSINDRDYTNDPEEQQKVIGIATNYNGNAIKNMPVVSDEGLVYNGNGRWMAGQLASANGTDGAYTQSLMNNAGQFGFTAEQVQSIPNARVAFELDERLPYNTSSLAIFNEQETQTQSNTGKAAAYARKLTPQAISDIVDAISGFNTRDAFFNDSKAPFELINRLIADGIISEREKAEMVDGDKLSALGRERLENIMLGTVFSNETIRLMGDDAGLKNSILRALPQIIDNKSLGEFSLEPDINDAIRLLYEVRNSKMPFRAFVSQTVIAEDGQVRTASDNYSPFQLLLAEEMTDGGVDAFRDVLTSYNNEAKQVQGGQVDIFGGLTSVDELKQLVLNSYGKQESTNEGASAGSETGSAAPIPQQSDAEVIEQAEAYDKENGTELTRFLRFIQRSKQLEEGESPHFHIGVSGSLLESLGIKGGIYTSTRTVNMGVHTNNEDHNLGIKEWLDIANGINTPLAVTRYRGFDNSYRVYTTAIVNGKTICVGIDVDFKGGTIEVSNIVTAFGRDISKIFSSSTEELIYPDEDTLKKTLGQSSPEHNSQVYDQESSKFEHKDTTKNPNTQISGQENAENLQNNTESIQQEEAEAEKEQAALEQAEAETNTNPTEAQKKAGNYKMGHVKLFGFDVTVENPVGSVRRGTDPDGKEWEQTMNNTYGYIRGTEGVDGDHIDVFIGPNLQSDKVFIVDQLDTKTSEFDEHKCMLGFDSMEEAQAAYLSNYEDGWAGMGPVSETTLDEFRKWIDSSHRKTKPFNEYKSVKVELAENAPVAVPQTPLETAKANKAKNESKSKFEQKIAESDAEIDSLAAELRDLLDDDKKLYAIADPKRQAERDAKIMEVGAKLAVALTKKGVYKFADFCDKMIRLVGDAVRPRLKQFYMSAKYAPENMSNQAQFDTTRTVDDFDVYTINTEQTRTQEEARTANAEKQRGAFEKSIKKSPYAKGISDDMLKRCVDLTVDNYSLIVDVLNGDATIEDLISKLPNGFTTDNIDGYILIVPQQQTKQENPVLQSYRQIKEQYPDAAVLFRTGDFYEIYEEDADELSNILGITVTNRNGMRMAGFPFHALDTYLPKIVRAGKRVAIADGIESPKTQEVLTPNDYFKNGEKVLYTPKDGNSEVVEIVDFGYNNDVFINKNGKEKVVPFSEISKLKQSKFKEGDIVYYPYNNGLARLGISKVNSDGTYNLSGDAANLDINLINIPEDKLMTANDSDKLRDFFIKQFSDHLAETKIDKVFAKDLLSSVEKEIDKLKYDVWKNNGGTDVQLVEAIRLNAYHEAISNYINPSQDNNSAPKNAENGAEILKSQENFVSLQPNLASNGQEQTGENNTVGRRNSTGVRNAGEGGSSPIGRTVDIQSDREWLSSQSLGDLRDGSKTKQEEYVSELLTNHAKETGSYLDRNGVASIGEKYNGKTGESEVYIDAKNNRVVKIKDPFAKSAIKGSSPLRILDELQLHNVLFENTPYTLWGYTDDGLGNVRLVLTQPFIDNTFENATQDEIDEHLSKLGFKKDGYIYRNGDGVIVTDVTGDNVLKDSNSGELYFIDPLIGVTDEYNPQKRLTIGTITKSKDTRDGSDIWLVNTNSRVSAEEFKDLKKRAKDNNGYWSSFSKNKGFLFKTEEDANNFNNITEDERTTDETAANTRAIRDEGTTCESEVETAISDADEQGRDVAAEVANPIITHIDETVEKANEQLMLLGYYEMDEGDFAETGVTKSATRKAVKDVTRVAKQLAKDLGIDAKVKATANIAPAGGDLTFRIPLQEGRELYVTIPINPVYSQSQGAYGDLEIPRSEHTWDVLKTIMYRVENPSGIGQERYGNNQFVETATSYDNFLRLVKWECRNYLPKDNVPAPAEYETLGEYAHRVAQDQKEKKQQREQTKAERKKDKNAIQADQLMGDLFADVVEDVKQAQQDQVQEQLNEHHEQVMAQMEEVEPDNTQNNEPSNTRVQTPNGGIRSGNGQEVQQNEPSGVDRDNSESVRDDGTGSGTVVAVNGAEQLPVNRNQHNFHNSRGNSLEPNTPKARFYANIAAIELMRELRDSNKRPTKAQQQVLAQYSGWGGLGTFFNKYDSSEYNTLHELFNEEELHDAELSINTAYYTPTYIIDYLWDIVGNLGFKGGDILEGSAGIGNILAQMPSSISGSSTIQAVELDQTTGGILQLLYPDAKVDIEGFQDVDVRPRSKDLVITNVPFDSHLKLFDEKNKDISDRFGLIHNFCIAKNVRSLREGGIGVFITTSGTLDKQRDLFQWLSEHEDTDVIGAFRLNNATFDGAPVTSDIIVVRKRINKQRSPQAIDVSSVTTERFVDYDTNPHPYYDGRSDAQKKKDTKRIAITYNKYFADHPENMGGEMKANYELGYTYRPEGIGLHPVDGKNQDKLLKKWVASFEEQEQAERPAKVLSQSEEVKGEKVGSLVVNSKGEICQVEVEDEKMVVKPIDTTNTKVAGRSKAEVLKDFHAVRDALNAVLDYQTANESDEGLKPLLAKLNAEYDSFHKKYGNFHANTKLSWLRNDIDYSSVAETEVYKQKEDAQGRKTAEVTKADVMSGRVLRNKADVKVDNIRDAIIMSIRENGWVNTGYIAGLLGRTITDVQAEMYDSGLVFLDPATSDPVVKYEYLSGNILDKLDMARAWNDNGQFDDNIRELERVCPPTIPSHLITVSLGATWLDPSIFADYVADKTGIPAQHIHVMKVGSKWDIDFSGNWERESTNISNGVHSSKLNVTIPVSKLLQAAINNQSVTVSKTEKINGESVTESDKEATQVCSTRIDQLKDEFQQWFRDKMQSEPERAAAIEETYNRLFNQYVPMRVSKEFIPEHFDGATESIKLNEWQAQAAVRATMQPLLLAHEVGSCKTFTMITAAMEMRRLGTAKKPMIVVQNATVNQFVSEAHKLYPRAKVLYMTDKDKGVDGRMAFYRKMKYNDWDMIIIPQSVFNTIPESIERKEQYIQEKIDEKRRVVELMKLEKLKAADNAYAEKHALDMKINGLEKEIEKMQADFEEEREARLLLSLEYGQMSKKQFDKKVKKEAEDRAKMIEKAKRQLSRKTDNIESFDDMDVDALFIDEAHEYKRLGFESMTGWGIKGIDKASSGRAVSLWCKMQTIFDRTDHKNVVFATGTPISNTAAEVWTFMKYLIPKADMQKHHIYYFDDFVHNFGKIIQRPEFKTDGKFKEVTRFAEYNNVPELVRLWTSCSDTVLSPEKLREMQPDTEAGGKNATDIFLPQTRTLRSVMKWVREQLEAFDKMSGQEKKENTDIPLRMYGIASAAAIDPRLVVDAPDEPNSKTNAAVKEILRALDDSKPYNGAVAIFSDKFRNSSTGFNLFEDIRQKLIDAGVPASQIAVISSQSKDQKQKIFDKVNAGEIRVILGSTQKLGVGVNIQERLFAEIHLDAPNRPMDYQQRVGRIIRQGNLHKEWGIPVRLIRFGVEDSLDVTAYQRLKTKTSFSDTVMKFANDMNLDSQVVDGQVNRSMEEDEDAGQFDNMIAQISGSQYAMLISNAERKLRKLEAEKKQFEDNQVWLDKTTRQARYRVSALTDNMAILQKRLDTLRKYFADGKVKSVKVAGKTISSDKAAEEIYKSLNERIDKVIKGQNTHGFDFRTDKGKEVASFDFELDGMKGTIGVQVRTELSGTDYITKRALTMTIPELGIDHEPTRKPSVKTPIEFIVESIVPGTAIERELKDEEYAINKLQSDIASYEQKSKETFTKDDEIRKLEDSISELNDKMKEEMAAKEAKYAEMDADVEAINVDAEKIDLSEDEDTDDAEKQISNEDYSEYSQLVNDAIDEALDNAGIEVVRVEEPTEDAGAEYSISNMDAEYLQAVKDDDMEKARKMVLDAAKIAMPNTKVVDEDGNPRVLYHGTPNTEFTTFDLSHLGENSGDKGLLGAGFYFNDNSNYVHLFADNKGVGKGRVIAAYLNLQNPFVVDDHTQSEIENLLEADKRDRGMYMDVVTTLKILSYGKEEMFRNKLISLGYDGVIRKDYLHEFVAFHPSQIKSAEPVTYDNDGNVIPLSKRFNAENDDIRYFRTPNGIVYGWAKDGKIYLTEDGLNPNTKIHEYTHLWAKAMQMNNPEGWQSVIDNFKGTPMWDEVVNDPNYQNLQSDDDICSEALARFSGSRGAERMQEIADEMQYEAKQSGLLQNVAKTAALLQRVKKALSNFWKWVSQDLFGIKQFTSPEEVTDRVLYDLVSSTELGNVNGDGMIEMMIDGRYTPEEMEEIKKWNEEHPYPKYNADMTLSKTEMEKNQRAFLEELTRYKHLRASFMERLGMSVTPKDQSGKPVPMKGETPHDFAVRFKEWENNQIVQEAQEAFEQSLKEQSTWFQKQVRRFVDKHKPIEDFQRMIEQLGGTVKDETDAYGEVTLVSGWVGQTTKSFVNNEMNGLAKACSDIETSGLLEDIDLVWQNIDTGITPEKEKHDGKRLTDLEMIEIYAQAKDCKERLDNGDPDAGSKGFTKNLTTSTGEEITYTKVIDMFEKNVSKELVDELWRAINASTKYSLNMCYENGLITKDVYDQFKDRRYYVPERGWRERDMEGREYHYKKGEKPLNGNPYNTALKKANGRESLAASPFAYIQSIAATTIVEVGKNRIKQKFLELVLANREIGLKTGAFRVRKLFFMNVLDENGKVKRDANGNPVVEELDRTPSEAILEHDRDIDKDIAKLRKDIGTMRRALNKYAGNEVLSDAAKRKIESIEQRIQDLEDSKHIATVVVDTHISQRTKGEKYQHIVRIMKDGEMYELELENELLANAVVGNFAEVNWLNNKGADLLRTSVRYMSAIATQYNPAFAAWNLFRDTQVAIAKNAVNKGAKWNGQFVKNIAACQGAIHRYVYADHLAGKESFSEKKYGKYLKEYFESGAPTGFSFLRDIESIDKDFAKMVKGQSKASKVANGTLGLFSAATEISELTVRFAQFVTARENGMSISDAAKEAKEISVNFDRKGALAGTISAFFSFFNATIQGTNTFIRDIVRNPKTLLGYSSVAVMMMVAGVLDTLLNPDDPDDDERWTDYDRNMNFIIGGKKIPVMHFFRMFYAMGVQATLYAQGKKTSKDAWWTIGNVVLDEIVPASVLQVHNFWDYNDEMNRIEFTPAKYAQAAAPSQISPIVDVFINRDFKGATINKPSYYGSEYQKDLYSEKRNVPKIYHDIARFLVEASGGNPDVKTKGDEWIDISASTIQHIVEGYTGGTGTFTGDIISLVADAVAGNALDESKIPVWNKFSKPYDVDKAYQQEYWRLYRRTNYFERKLNDAKKNNRDEYYRLMKTPMYDEYVNASRLVRHKPEENQSFSAEDVKRLMVANKVWTLTQDGRKTDK